MRRFSRKFAIYVLISIITLFMANNSLAQEQSKILSDFEKLMDAFNKFFSTNPLLLEKQSSKSSPTGFIFFYNAFKNYKISYDVKKTESLISPYIGYIIINYSNHV